MSVYDFYKRKMQVDTHSTGKNYSTLGEKLKSEADMIMNLTWDNDPQSKVAYIYDYFHDDQPEIKDHMTYENTTKTRIDIKFIVKSYQSMDKDQVDYYIQFRPDEKFDFTEKDELYYYEKDFHKKYGADYPIGMMIDIPDDRGIYRKWLICRDEPANQFPKFLILPLNYRLYWIEQDGNKRYKRNMWCAIRMQSSYTNGSYVDKVFSRPDNQTKLWFSMNSITEKFWYSDDNDKNMRLIVSAPIKEPVTWRITKCENAQPLGIQKLTLYQDRFNEHTDYVNLETGEMYANYFDSEIAPTDPSTPTTPPSSITARISASTSTIKVGGSYKNLTVNLFNDSNEDITTEYADATFTWTCSIDNEDWTDKVTWRAGAEYNQKKVKFSNDTSTIGKILSVKCEIIKDNLPIKSEILPLELTE
jgi:hypothetical protein|nr:MAG TPA: hypothetical protein [Caudoviricetes sp.]